MVLATDFVVNAYFFIYQVNALLSHSFPRHPFSTPYRDFRTFYMDIFMMMNAIKT